MDILRAQEHNKELHEQFNHQVRCDVAFRKHFLFHYIKGYFCYKTISSQNVLSEAQFKNFFIS